jgi:hypothetical protein
MAYKTVNDVGLPEYITKLPDSLAKKWIVLYNDLEESYGSFKALMIANRWLKSKIQKREIVAQTQQSVSIIKFTVDDSKELIKRTDDGEDYIDFVLTDNLPDKEGVIYPVELLQKWVEQINSGDVLIGDYDHEAYDKLLKEGLSPDEVIARLKDKPGIAKTLKAVFEKGKLWVRAIIDKRYKKLIKEKSKGISLEASLIKDVDGNIVDGQLGGFTFALQHDPYNERAVIA